MNLFEAAMNAIKCKLNSRECANNDSIEIQICRCNIFQTPPATNTSLVSKALIDAGLPSLIQASLSERVFDD